MTKQVTVTSTSVVSSGLSNGAIDGIAAAAAVTFIATVTILAFLYYKLKIRKLELNRKYMPEAVGGRTMIDIMPNQPEGGTDLGGRLDPRTEERNITGEEINAASESQDQPLTAASEPQDSVAITKDSEETAAEGASAPERPLATEE